MTILILKEKYEVLAYCELNENFTTDTPALDFLKTHYNNHEFSGSAKGFKPLFQRYSTDGTNKLTTDLFHEADKNEKIFEFIKGRLRIYCFKDGNKLILTHGAIKKTQKVDPQDIAKAVSMKNKYFKT